MTEWRVVTARGHEVFVREDAGAWSVRVPMFGATAYAVEAPHPDHWPVAIGESLQLLPLAALSPYDPAYLPGGVVHLEQVQHLTVVATA